VLSKIEEFMQTIALWLASLLPSFVARVLAALGMGVVSFTGWTIVWDQVKGLIISNFSGLPVAIAQLAGLAGADTGLGIILGAITMRITYVSVASAARIAGIQQ
jgi:hypothetical protein